MSMGHGAFYRDPLCRFYTEPSVSTLLVALLSDNKPIRVLDLASGTGTLSDAAGRRWQSGELVTVDIDPLCSPNRPAANRRHIIADALDPALPTLIEADKQGFDLTLCNPPFRLSEWRPAFGRILDDAGLARAFSHCRYVGTEALFVAQSLRLARGGGEIGLIVPDGLMTGRRTEGFRAALLCQHDIRSVVQLPRGVFKRTEARAFIVILDKGTPSRGRVALRRLDGSGVLSQRLWVDNVAAERRMDFDFHDASGLTGGPTLLDLGAEVIRGSLENPGSDSGGMPVFHTADFPEGFARVAHDLSGSAPSKRAKLVIAGPGDILVARVHRSLHLKVCGVAEGHATLSSCVFRVRVPTVVRDRVLSALLSDAGAEKLASTARGVGPRMLGKADFLEMPIPW